MSDELKSLVLDRLFADEAVTDDVRMVVMAALESDDDLSSVLSADATPKAVSERLENPAESAAVPSGTFLRSLTVQGFRGIGERLTVQIPEGPGLIVIAGRNGSGKSSMAEALEIALTGVNSRWADKGSNTVWSTAWRNLHVKLPAQVQLAVTEAGAGVTTIEATWQEGPDVPVTQVVRKVLRHGQKQEPIDSLGWSSALELYRPLLSYDELGSILEGKPIEFYLQLHKLLGLEQLTAATDRLGAHASRLKEPVKAFTDAKAATRKVLLAVDDAQAKQLAVEVNRQVPTTEKIRPWVTAGVSDAIPPAWRLAAALQMPERTEIVAAAADLREAVTGIEEQTGQVEVHAADRTRLLEEALSFHEEHGGGECPVCGTGRLDDGWATRARAQVNESRRASAALVAARGSLSRARAAVIALIDRLPTIPQHPDLRADEAVAAISALRTVPQDAGLGLAEHVVRCSAAAFSTVDEIVVRAAELIEQRQDVWAPAIASMAVWLAAAEEFLATEGQRSVVTAAQNWMKGNADKLRDERLAPMAEQSAHIWSVLRQQSNVELGTIRLTGQGNHRKVELMALVDGTSTQAFSVMSQGELQALALSIFLPRATAPASPFRFVVLDDPIQAMDPSKIEGFLDVLVEIAATRQVIVLSHDDRLPAAIRRRDIRARLVEVTRGLQSTVTVTEVSRPAQRLLEDGDAINRDPSVPLSIKNRAVLVLCREAIEETAWEVFVSKSLARGEDLERIEATWKATLTVRGRVTLALTLEKGGDITGWLVGHRAATMRVINTGLHQGVEDVKSALDCAKKTAGDLRLELS